MILLIKQPIKQFFFNVIIHLISNPLDTLFELFAWLPVRAVTCGNILLPLKRGNVSLPLPSQAMGGRPQEVASENLHSHI